MELRQTLSVNCFSFGGGRKLSADVPCWPSSPKGQTFVLGQGEPRPLAFFPFVQQRKWFVALHFLLGASICRLLAWESHEQVNDDGIKWGYVQQLDRVGGIGSGLVPVSLWSAKPGAAVFLGEREEKERMTSGRKRLSNKKRKKSGSITQSYSDDLRSHGHWWHIIHTLLVCAPVRLSLIFAFNPEVIGLCSYKKYFLLISHTKVSDFWK